MSSDCESSESFGRRFLRIIPPGIGYSPLWTAHAGGRALATRRGETGLLEIRAPARETLSVDLRYGPGLAEWAGVGLSAAALLLMCLGRRLTLAG
ncbi:MAG: hypothetical protein HY953_07780 [Candidatus Rokubacteria bacterium]|nr:hypothetical protein [Candidatus Rokubacteria bacterium]